MPTQAEYQTMLQEAVNEDGTANTAALSRIQDGLKADLAALTAATDNAVKLTEDNNRLARENIDLYRKTGAASTGQAETAKQPEGETPLETLMKGWNPLG